jgi:anti-sigma factor RsiW
VVSKLQKTASKPGLNLVDWHDSAYAYVVVGAVELDLLQKIVPTIQEAYGET